MLINGSNVFPLNKIYSRLTGYYMSSNGQVYSNFKNPTTLKLLSGSGDYYTLARQSFNKMSLRSTVMRHVDFQRETRSPTPSVPQERTSPPNRCHATTIEEGVKGRGSIIGAVIESKITFGSDPKIHMTEQSLKDEMQRLALATPGVKYIALKITHGLIATGLNWD